jgi:hypothetical protein
VLDAGALVDPAATLRAVLMQASDGDTIGLRGAFAAHTLRIGIYANSAVVRLLGMPAAVAWHNVHLSASAGHDRYNFAVPATLGALGLVEYAAAAAIGFPSASLEVQNNCLEIYAPVWLESLFISSGDRTVDMLLHVQAPGGFPAITVHAIGLTPPAAVLRRCWVTAYNGTGISVAQRASVALLQCCVTNSRCAAVFCSSDTTLRLRGCHLLWNAMHLGVGDAPLDAAQRIAAANVVVSHPNNDPNDVALIERLYRTDSDHVRLLD